MSTKLKKRYLMFLLNALENPILPNWEVIGWSFRRRSFAETKLIFRDPEGRTVIRKIEDILVEKFGSNKSTHAEKRDQCRRLHFEFSEKTGRLRYAQ